MVMYDTDLDICSVLEPFKDPIIATPDAIPFAVKRLDEVVVKKTAEKKIGKKIAGGGIQRMKLCKRCGEPGHMAKTCPDAKKDEAESIGAVEEFRRKVTEEDIEKIQEMREAGYKSHEVAQELKIHLVVVNKHWNPLV